MIIGIDEVDKIRDSDRAEAFLNDIKAIFGVPGCLYLVSLSEDAMAGFARRTPSIRTTFDSAFDELVPVGPMTYRHSEQLLFKRVTGVPRPFIALCHVLAGGLPRDLVRAARALIEVTPARGEKQLPDTAGDLSAVSLNRSARRPSGSSPRTRRPVAAGGPPSTAMARHDAGPVHGCRIAAGSRGPGRGVRPGPAAVPGACRVAILLRDRAGGLRSRRPEQPGHLPQGPQLRHH